MAHYRSIFSCLVVLSFAVCSLCMVEMEGGLTKEEVIGIYKNFDAAIEDTPACLEDDYSIFLCPFTDDFDDLPCAGDEAVEGWCSEQLEGVEIGNTMLDGTNALNGCIIYVGWGDNQRGCCASHACHTAAMEHESEDSEDEDDSEDHDSEEHDSEEHDSEEHDSEEHDSEEHDSEDDSEEHDEF